MDNNQMREGIKNIGSLYEDFKNKYDVWFGEGRDQIDTEKNYSIVGVWEKGNDLQKKFDNVRDNFLIPLANDCILCEEKVTGLQYKLLVQNQSDEKRGSDRKVGRITDYVWAKLIGKGIVIGHYVSFKPSSKKYPSFYIGLDIENSDSTTNQRESFYDRVTKLKTKINDNVIDDSLKCLGFSEDNKPIIEIDLSNYADDRNYQDLVQEYTNAIVKLKALYRYVIFDGNETEKKEMWKKVESSFNSLYIAEQNGIVISSTILKINDLVFGGCKQLVLTGAPGTGKTYSAKEFVDWQIVTEAIRDKVIVTNKDKTLKELKNELINKLESDSDGNGDKKEKYLNRYKMVQFHPSYDYTDFVEGLRPVKLDGKTQFVRMDGEFKKFCRIAAGDKENNYYFIIDEINRADLSKVFGELMYCLEEGYRGENNKISTQYNNLPTYCK